MWGPYHLGVIYESRPNVSADAAGLCLKSGNALILRGGSESFNSSSKIVEIIFKQRTVNVGVMSINDCLDWGFTGPPLRASGVPWDLRKSQPYEIYSEIDFFGIVENHQLKFVKNLLHSIISK